MMPVKGDDRPVYRACAWVNLSAQAAILPLALSSISVLMKRYKLCLKLGWLCDHTCRILLWQVCSSPLADVLGALSVLAPGSWLPLCALHFLLPTRRPHGMHWGRSLIQDVLGRAYHFPALNSGKDSITLVSWCSMAGPWSSPWPEGWTISTLLKASGFHCPLCSRFWEV